jgi:hypothetical protein
LSRNPGALTSRTRQGHAGLFRGYFTFCLLLHVKLFRALNMFCAVTLDYYCYCYNYYGITVLGGHYPLPKLPSTLLDTATYVSSS